MGGLLMQKMSELDSDYSDDDLMNYYYYTVVVAVKDRNDAANDLVAVLDSDVDFDGIHSDIDSLRGYFWGRSMTHMNFGVDDGVDGGFHNS